MSINIDTYMYVYTCIQVASTSGQVQVQRTSHVVVHLADLYIHTYVHILLYICIYTHLNLYRVQCKRFLVEALAIFDKCSNRIHTEINRSDICVCAIRDVDRLIRKFRLTFS